MNTTVKITATVAVWLSRSDDPLAFMDDIGRGDGVSVIERLTFFGKPDRETFGDWTRAGDAEVTVSLLPRDEQVGRAVSMLKEQLNAARAEWLTKQQEILDRINKLQAIEFTPSMREIDEETSASARDIVAGRSQA